MRNMIGFAMVLALLCGIAPRVYAAEGYPFYAAGNAKPADQTREYFAKAALNEGFAIPSDAVAWRISEITGKPLEDRNDLAAFVRDEKEVKVRDADWDAGKVGVDYVSLGSKTSKHQRVSIFYRAPYRSEKVLVYHGKVFASLACGNPLHDPRDLASKPVPTVAKIETKNTRWFLPPSCHVTSKNTATYFGGLGTNFGMGGFWGYGGGFGFEPSPTPIRERTSRCD